MALAESFLEPIINKDLHVLPKEGGVEVPYVRNFVQVELDRRWLENRAKGKVTRQVVLKPRQPGCTTGVAASHIADAMTRVVRSIITAHTDDTIELVWETVERFCRGMPPDGEEEAAAYAAKRPKCLARRVEFRNGGRLYIRHSGKTAKGKALNVGRGGTFQTALWTECDYWPNFRATMDALSPALSKNDPFGRVVMESTMQRGGGGEYKSHVEKSLAGETDWDVAFFSWLQVPDYRLKVTGPERDEIRNGLTPKEVELREKHGAKIDQLAWRRWIIRQDHSGDEEAFAEAYPTTVQDCLQAGVGSLLPAAAHHWLKTSALAPRRVMWAGSVDNATALVTHVPPPGHSMDALVSIWAMPAAAGRYKIGVDTADAEQTATRGSENAVFVIDADTGDQVAEWHAFCDAKTTAAVAVALARFYNGAQIAIEVDAAGEAVLALMRNLFKYSHFYMRETIDRSTNQPKKLIGFKSRSGSNNLLISSWEPLIKGKKARCWSETTAEQAIAFSQRRGVAQKKQEHGGTKDDLVKAWMLAIHACENREAWVTQTVVPATADEVQSMNRTRRRLTWGDIGKSKSVSPIYRNLRIS